MSKKINKINNLKKVQSFLQLNYLKGFKYVDRAGEFLNNCYSREPQPPFIMDPTGMTVKLTERIQLKVSPNNIWMHFVEPDTFDYQSRGFLDKATLANSLFEPTTYTRIGWRSHLVYECSNNYPEIIPNSLLFGGDFNELVFTKKFDNIDSRISFSRVVNEDTKVKAILIDIDLYKNKNIERENFGRVGILVREMEEIYKSDEMLELINGLLN